MVVTADIAKFLVPKYIRLHVQQQHYTATLYKLLLHDATEASMSHMCA